MRKIVVSEGISLDGVFDAQSMGRWAQPFASEAKNEFVRKGVMAADALLYGRTTYDMESYYWPSQKKNQYGIADKMNSLPKYVVTSRPLQDGWNNSTAISGNIIEEVTRLKQQPGEAILIKGSGTLVAAVMQAGLVDELQLMVHPVVVGEGQRFFKPEMDMAKLKLIECQPIDQGIVLLTYQPVL